MRKNKSYVSNAFLTKPQIDAILSLEKTQVIIRDDILLILEENPDLIRLYFYTDNEALERMRYLLPNCSKSIVADIVGKTPLAENLSKRLTENGFNQYSVFVRMTCDSPLILDNADVSRVTHATSDDIDDIYSLLYSEFDPLFSHLPEKKDILSAITKNEITVIQIEKEIAGFAYFEVISARNVCLRYFMVNKKHRKQGIGKDLLAYTFSQHHEGLIYTLWIGTYNKTIELYKRLNFKQDAMIDYILLYKGEE